ncbi:MAG TPA: molybdopterin dehydrogenase [Peptococcaceae bacterium]|nr:molybdopterin dehydrogenase [Peptococcaceae bacterium]
MFTINQYSLAESLEQAYELNQSRSGVILGGTLWLKMGRKKIIKAIDLSALGLDTIEEEADRFTIGCMCTLRDLETHAGLNRHFNGVIAQALGSIVGVQMRNGATVGGSVFSRYGFSDVLTVLMALDAYVELHKGGLVPLAEFAAMPYDNDVLVRVMLRKDARKAAYSSFRKSAGDFPVLNCAVSNLGDQWHIVLGARPGRARRIQFTGGSNPSAGEIDGMAEQIMASIPFGSNLLGSKTYRQILADGLVRRNIAAIVSGGAL